MRENLLITATERFICSRELWGMRGCMCPKCAPETLSRFELVDSNIPGTRILVLRDECGDAARDDYQPFDRSRFYP